MSNLVFNATARAAYRKAILCAPGWNSYRIKHGLDSANLSLDDMHRAAAALGVNPADYGQPRKRRGHYVPGGNYTPKARVHGPEITKKLHADFLRYQDKIPGNKAETCRDIFADIMGHDWQATERQFAFVNDCVDRARFNPAPKYAPEIYENEPKQPENTPAPTPAPAPDIANAIATAIGAALAGLQPGRTDESRVIELIREHGGRPAHVTIDLRTPGGNRQLPNTLIHNRFPLLLSAVNAAVNVMLVGPAGTGKTHAAAQVAETIGIPFEFTGAIDSKYALSGFIDAQGRIVSTAFRRAFENGGVFLFDEIDASLPGAVLAFNAALAGDYCDFPDGKIRRHENFRAIAAANTYGQGANRTYVGRYQQDAAALDRYAMLDWPIDESLESALIGQPRPDNAPVPVELTPVESESECARLAANWLATVRQFRAKVESAGLRHIVSPRATVIGARLLAAGWQWDDCRESVLYKGLDTDSRAKLI